MAQIKVLLLNRSKQIKIKHGGGINTLSNGEESAFYMSGDEERHKHGLLLLLLQINGL